MEADHEADGLRFWAGDPTVHLFEADEQTGAILIERCSPGTSLRTLPEPEQDVIIAGLLRRLWRTPPRNLPFRPLALMTEYWASATLAKEDHWTDAGLVREGLHLFKHLHDSAPSADTLLATDLHAGNVLKAHREPWLVIDPKPFLGDPAYDATQHLFNCEERLLASPRDTIHRFADLLEVDRERVRLWTFARAAAEPRDTWSDSTMSEIARSLG